MGKPESTSELGLSDLYADLASTQAREAERTLASVPQQVVLRQGSVCLTESVAHLRYAAAHFLTPGGARSHRLEELSRELLLEAAAFEEAADSLQLLCRRLED